MRSAYNATVQYAWEGYPESLASPDTGQNRWEWRSGETFARSCCIEIVRFTLLLSLACGEAGEAFLCLESLYVARSYPTPWCQVSRHARRFALGIIC